MVECSNEPMITKFKEHIKANFSFLQKEKILIAISGGVDSVVLAHLFHSLNFNIALAHCNFQLRGVESDKDAEFVQQLAEQLGCEFYLKEFNTKEQADQNKTSIQITARNLRYQWFSELKKNYGFSYVATAHHLNDSLETFLINFTRGTGLEGLTGIPQQNGYIVRPLLPFSKEEIINYAKEKELDWREDRSNSETKYKRNKIRHNVIPELISLNPNLLQGFSKTLDHLNDSRAIINDSIEKVKTKIVSSDNGVVTINIEEVLKLSNPKAYLFELLKPYKFTEWTNIYELLNAQSGKKIYSDSYVVLKDRGVLLIKEREKSEVLNDVFYITEDEHEIVNPIRITIKNTDKKKSDSKNYVLVNKNLVTFPIILRKREEGDFFYPTGMTGKKKVSKFFKDEKLSEFKKKETWLLCNANNEIIWIVGMRQDRRFMADVTSNNILKFSI